MRSQDEKKKAEIRAFFNPSSAKNIAFDSAKQTVSVTPEMQKDLQKYFGIDPSFFTSIREADHFIAQHQLAQDFNPNHLPGGSPDSTGGQFAKKEQGESSEPSTQNNLKNKINEIPKTEEDLDNKPDGKPITYLPEHMPPGGLSIIDENMKIARKRYFSLLEDPSVAAGKAIAAGLWFVSKVHTHGEWDYKNHLDENGNPKTNLRDFGNFNYGAVGTALGFSPQVLLRGGGIYQEFFTPDAYNKNDGHGYASCISPYDKPDDSNCQYGDSLRDQNNIKRGIHYAQQQGFGTFNQFF